MKHANGQSLAACRHVLAVTAAAGKLPTVIMRACPGSTCRFCHGTGMAGRREAGVVACECVSGLHVDP